MKLIVIFIIDNIISQISTSCNSLVNHNTLFDNFTIYVHYAVINISLTVQDTVHCWINYTM